MWLLRTRVVGALVTAALVAGAFTDATSAAASVSQSRLDVGQSWSATMGWMTSPDGSFQLLLDGDALALQETLTFADGQHLGTGTWGAANPPTNDRHDKLIMQSDGNLVLYSSAGKAVWSTRTGGTGHSNHFVIQNDGNLVVYTSAGKAVWSSGSGRALLAAGMTLPSGTALRNEADQGLPWDRLSMRSDGDLVLTYGSRVSWSSGTHVAGSHLSVQRDGNLVIYAPTGKAVWSTNTGGAGLHTYLLVGPVHDAQLAVLGGAVLWERGS